MVGPPPPIFGGPQPGGEAVASPIDPLEKRDLDYARVASRRLRAIVAACYGSIAGIRAADKGLPLFLKTNADPTNLGKVGRPLKEMAEFLEDDIRDVYLFEEDLKQRTLNLSQALAGFAPAAKPATTTPMPMPMTPDDPLGGR